MEPVQTSDERVRLRAENVGGIDETAVEFRPGVNLLTGWNATNRTSLLQAIMAALGSERASLKGDAEEGRVEMELGGETYTRTIERRAGDVVFGGTPFTDDPELADLFAFLLESNDARQAVAMGDDLREVIMRPVDTDAIQAEIESLEARRREIESALEERERLTDERASLADERADLESRIEEKRDALSAKRDEIEAADAQLEETRERKAELEAKLSELQDRRSTLEDVRFRLETERETVDGIRDDLAAVEASLDDLSEPSGGEMESLEGRTEELRRQKRAVDSKITQLQALIQFNEEMLSGEEFDELDVLGSASESSDDVTSRLLPEGEAFVCWTCGEEATRTDVEAMLETLQDRRAELADARRRVSDELEEVTDRIEEIESRQRRLEDLQRRRDDLEAELAQAESEIESLTERREGLVEEIEAIEGEVETLREEEYDEIVELHKEANALELEIEQLESELERTEERLDSIDERIDERESLAAERSAVKSDLEDARTRIERLEDEAVEQFNAHMADVLDVLQYENIDRIWLERVEREVREGRRTVRRGFFDLHVVRSSESGAAYEDTIEHLSESEREVTGLVFALAGYLVHDVYETMPFMLLDSIEAIDSNRIASLIEYLDEYADYLVAALLPEDAEPVDDRHHRITEI